MKSACNLNKAQQTRTRLCFGRKGKAKNLQSIRTVTHTRAHLHLSLINFVRRLEEPKARAVRRWRSQSILLLLANAKRSILSRRLPVIICSRFFTHFHEEEEGISPTLAKGSTCNIYPCKSEHVCEYEAGSEKHYYLQIGCTLSSRSMRYFLFPAHLLSDQRLLILRARMQIFSPHVRIHFNESIHARSVCCVSSNVVSSRSDEVFHIRSQGY